MPTLQRLICTIETGTQNLILREYGTKYGDSFVETYVAVPADPANFTVHLRSEGYIASGLSMHVFMDGIFQCNRNRCGLKHPDMATSSSQTEIDFCVRQKEKKLGDGSWEGHPWTFAQLNTAAAEAATETRTDVLHSVGTIEVVVRRCEAQERDVNGQTYAIPPNRLKSGDTEIPGRSGYVVPTHRLMGSKGGEASSSNYVVPTHRLGGKQNQNDSPSNYVVPSHRLVIRKEAKKNAARNANRSSSPHSGADTGGNLSSLDGASDLVAIHGSIKLACTPFGLDGTWEPPVDNWPDDPKPKADTDTWGGAPDVAKEDTSNKQADKPLGVPSVVAEKDTSNQRAEANPSGNTTDNNNNTWTSTDVKPASEKAQSQSGSRSRDAKRDNKASTNWNEQSNQPKVKKPKPIDPARPFIKSYWSSWNQPPKTEASTDIPAEPLLAVPGDFAAKRDLSHQVQAGKGSVYHHKIGRPKYLDSMEKPYAVFVFKYRSKEVIKKKVDVKVKQPREDYKKRTDHLTKEEVLELLRAAKKKAGYNTDSSLDDDSDES